MIFLATESQVFQIIANAVNASRPAGMGILHYEAKEYPAETFKMTGGGLILDYFEGRMVKLAVRKVAHEEWEVFRPRDDPDPEYQSWASKYPTTKALIESGGGIV